MRDFLTVIFPYQSMVIVNADFMASGVAVLLEEYALDGNTQRFALLATMPVIFCVSLVRNTGVPRKIFH